MTISAVVFDFDGLVLETEEPIYLAWKELWAENGHELTLTDWARCIGTTFSEDSFDPVRELSTLCGRELDGVALDRVASARARSLLVDADLLPGVVEWLVAAEDAGMGIAIASSSPREWIVHHLERLGHLDRFPVITCYDDVGVHKPEPHVYVEACQRLGVAPAEAVAVEDSSNGVAAAKAAGLWCVAVPTTMTGHLDFSAADLVVDSLATTSLATVVDRLAGVR